MGHATVDELREKLLYLKQRFEIISATQAVKLLDQCEPLQKNFAVVTVDDGYRDFRTNFLPLVEELNLPATLFVCSGAICTGSVWFQNLYDLIFRIRGERLYLPWADRRIYFGDAEHRVLTIERMIAPYMKRLARTARRERLDDLLRANPVEPMPDSEDAFCTRKDLLELKASRWIELHLHGHNHDPFETLTEAELEDDINACRHFFAEALGIVSNVLSYPSGRFKPEHEKVLQRLGVQHAFSTISGFERPLKTHQYCIMRTGMGNEPMAAFHWSVCKLLQG